MVSSELKFPGASSITQTEYNIDSYCRLYPVDKNRIDDGNNVSSTEDATETTPLNGSAIANQKDKKKN